jgi:hypothetical protein
MIDVGRIITIAFVAGVMLTIVGVIVFVAQLSDDEEEDLP